jgi:uroporphyrinogen-III synthase
MDNIKRVDKPANIISTKKLTTAQTELFHSKVSAKSNDFIQVNTNRISSQIFREEIENVIITSKNGVESIVLNADTESLKFKNIFCVGRRTKRMIEQKIGPVVHSAKNAKTLANYLVDNIEGNQVTYFCSDLRLDDLPTILGDNNIEVNEVIAYNTKYNSQKVDDSVEGVMFYSPSTVKSFMQNNSVTGIAFCIGESTAREAKKHFEEVRISKVPTVESVIELVNDNYV